MHLPVSRLRVERSILALLRVTRVEFVWAARAWRFSTNLTTSLRATPRRRSDVILSMMIVNPFVKPFVCRWITSRKDPNKSFKSEPPAKNFKTPPFPEDPWATDLSPSMKISSPASRFFNILPPSLRLTEWKCPIVCSKESNWNFYIK